MDLLRRVKAASEKKGLLLNTKKTKIMVIDEQSSGEEFLLDYEPRLANSFRKWFLLSTSGWELQNSTKRWVIYT